MFSLIIIYHLDYDHFVLIVPLIVFTLEFALGYRRNNKIRGLVLLWGFVIWVFFISRIMIYFNLTIDVINIIFAFVLYGSFALLVYGCQNCVRQGATAKK